MTSQTISITAAAGGLVLLLGWRIWLLFRPRASRLDHPAIFLLLIFTALLVLRLPEIRWAREINPDESQMLAQGLRYLSHPIPWRDVDGTTSGPLDSLLLSVPIACGAPANWATSRTMLWAVQCLTLFFIYRSLRCFGTRAEAQLALLPTVFFYAFVLDPDFTHYSSETLPVLLLSICIYLLARTWVTGKTSMPGLFLLGFIAGCIPLTKLQATPLALFLVATGLAEIIIRHRKAGKIGKNAGRELAVVSLGALVFPVLVLGTVAACGTLDDFWKSYILAPAAYTQGSLSEKIKTLRTVLVYDSSFRMYFVSAAAGGMWLLLSASQIRKPHVGKRIFWPLLIILAVEGLAVLCLLVAGKAFCHYLLLLIPAQGVLFGLMFAAGKELLLASRQTTRNPSAMPNRWFLAGCAVVISLQVYKAPIYVNTLRNIDIRISQRKSFVARRVLRASHPGDSLSIWGWMPSYYVETGLIPATRDAIGHFVIDEGPYRDYFQHRYLSDLKQSKPTIFIDSVAEGVHAWTWTKENAHESFPGLMRFIDDNYGLWLTIHITVPQGMGTPVRIYLQKQRLAELHLAPEEITIPIDPSLAPD